MACVLYYAQKINSIHRYIYFTLFAIPVSRDTLHEPDTRHSLHRHASMRTRSWVKVKSNTTPIITVHYSAFDNSTKLCETQYYSITATLQSIVEENAILQPR